MIIFSLIRTLVQLEHFTVAESILSSLVPNLYESGYQTLSVESFILLADCQVGVARSATGIQRHIQINKAINLLDHALTSKYSNTG